MTPKDLQEVVAEALDVPMPTVSFHARRLREGGFLTKGGRGRSAPSMRSIDAARLTLAILASETTSDSADVLHAFSEFQPLPSGCAGKFLEHLGGDSLNALTAVEMLFRNLAGGTLAAFIRSIDSRADLANGLYMGIRLRGAARSLSIGFSDNLQVGQCVFSENAGGRSRGYERVHRVFGDSLIAIASAFNRPSS